MLYIVISIYILFPCFVFFVEFFLYMNKILPSLRPIVATEHLLHVSYLEIACDLHDVEQIQFLKLSFVMSFNKSKINLVIIWFICIATFSLLNIYDKFIQSYVQISFHTCQKWHYILFPSFNHQPWLCTIILPITFHAIFFCLAYLYFNIFIYAYGHLSAKRYLFNHICLSSCL